MAYRNYLACLHAVEDSEAVIELVAGRKASGFADSHEAGFSLALNALALDEVGLVDSALSQIEQLKSDPETLGNGVVAEALIRRRSGAKVNEVAGLYRRALEAHPDSTVLMTHMVECLDSSIPEEASELAATLLRIAQQRQLVPREVYRLGECYLTLGEAETALHFFSQGQSRYPDESMFLYGKALANHSLGDQEASHAALQQYLAVGKGNARLLSDLAVLAVQTGRLDQAIQLFQRALRKAIDDGERAQLHKQLWELKRRRGDNGKEILRHAMLFGRFVQDDPAEEAQFLMMALLSPRSGAGEEDDGDDDVRQWHREIRDRLATFSNQHPGFPALQTFHMPADLPDDEKARRLAAKMAEITLPERMVASSMELASRCAPYPLVFRAEMFLGPHSAFRFWSECVSSSEASLGIHISYDLPALTGEASCIARGSDVCIDITALLTLAQLDMLEVLPSYFHQISISLGTKRAIDSELFGDATSHPLAERIEEWRLKYRPVIRVRGPRHVGEDVDLSLADQQPLTDVAGQAESPIDKALGDGVGESVLLAHSLDLLLYSDEAIVRKEALDTYQVHSFCTIAFVKKLREDGVLTLDQESRCLCEMIRKNFRLVPFNGDHLNACLEELRTRRARAGGGRLSPDDLRADRDMGALLRQFSDGLLDDLWLGRTAVDWWLSLLEAGDEMLETCIESPAFAWWMRTAVRVGAAMEEYGQEDRLGHLFAQFLVRAYELGPTPISEAWSAIKSCVARLFPGSEDRYDLVVFTSVAKWMAKELEESELSANDSLMRLFMVTSYLPPEDCTRMHDELYRLRSDLLRPA